MKTPCRSPPKKESPGRNESCQGTRPAGRYQKTRRIIAPPTGKVNDFMKAIKLLRLTLENFKACASRTFEFDGRNAAIYGANGTGKTTVYNALTWLLFDKIAGGDGKVMSYPDIKPNGENGEVADHTAISSVEAEFSVDGETVTLKREYKEVWEAKRGASEKSMNGHTSLYFWNGVPVQLQDFKTRLSETIASEDLFWALSNVRWFCKGMDWKSRRTMLADVCGMESDAEILAANAERFPGLAEAMNGLPLPDFRKKIETARNKLERAQDEYPARLDEIRKTIRQYDDTDFNALRSMRERREKEIRKKMDELSKLDNGTLIVSKRNELQGVRNQAGKLRLENERHRQSQAAPTENRRPEMEETLRRFQNEMSRCKQRAAADEQLAQSLSEKIAALKEDYDRVQSEAFTNAVCPTCGQTLPPDAQEKARLKFESDKQKRMGDILSTARFHRNNLDAAKHRREEELKDMEEARKRVKSLTVELQNLPAPQMQIVSDMNGYAAQMADYQRQAAALQEEIAGLEAQSAEGRAALENDIARLRFEISKLDEAIAGESVLNNSKAREEEILAEMTNAADELAALNKQRDMCEAFTRFKAEYVESGVNGHFRTVKFKLFQPQVNGGLKECCDAYVGGGRLDHGLNTGAEYNAGLDVIATLSERYGIRVPLFVDGAESVSELLPIDTQVIRLVVSRDDTELRMEVEV